MPMLRPSLALRAANTVASQTTRTTTPGNITSCQQVSRRTQAAARTLSTTSSRAAEHAHEDQYDPPSGWLWGIKPGEKPEKEGWETVWVWGFFGSLGLGVVAYAFKPDTSIQTWALEEARRRLEVEGILKEPESKP